METIGHYEIVKIIGEGGIGRVFLARDTTLDRHVALKVLSSATPDPENIARFEREAKALAALDHPNILSIHEFGRVNNTPYVVMELLDGKNLREILNGGPLPHHTALGFAVDIANGLSAAHAKGIHHRDLKPENIFVTNDGRVKIVDFGLANTRVHEQQSMAEAKTLTSPGTVLGTVGYMSPEQVRGEKADHRSDLFAFGAVLYEMLTGKRPFDEPSLVETLHAVLKKEPSVRSMESAGVPAPLIGVVTRCMEKSPIQRFQSARDLAHALKNVPSQTGWVSTPRTFRTSSSQSHAGRQTSVAVLPFANISSDADMEYFSDGITEDIINSLSQVSGLFVAARTSSFAFKGKTATIADIGTALKVNTVLEGSVRRAGNRLRITAQLVDVADGYHLWSERYDRELDDVFAIQDDIAMNIAQKLRVALSEGAAEEPLVKPATRNMEAYELYMKARYLVEQRGEGLVRGLEFFNQAVAKDPEYALAYAGLAETLSLLGFYSIADPRHVLPKAKGAAQRALDLDPNLAEAHNAMATVSLMLDWDWARAEAGFDRALEINPNYVSSRYWRGVFCRLFVQGRKDEALRETMRAVDLDPMATIPAYALGLVLIGSGRYDEAVACAERALWRDPMQAIMYRILGVAKICLGKYEDAAAALDMGASLSMRHPWFVGDLGVVHAAMGDRALATKLQEELIARSKESFVSGLALAVIPCALDDVEEAVRYIEQAYEQHDPLLIVITSWPTVEKAREHPRVRGLLRQMGIAWLG